VSAPEHGLSQLAVVMAPATLLRRLADAGAAPDVSVHLAGGSVLAGRPVRVGSDHGQEVVLLAGGRSGQLGCALLSSLVAVEVREPERFQDVLSEGRLPPPMTGEPVTRLALRREFAPTEEFPLWVDWEAQPDTPPALANLDRVLRGLRDIAVDVRADEMGRQAWARIRVLRVRAPRWRQTVGPGGVGRPVGGGGPQGRAAARPARRAGPAGRRAVVIVSFACGG
jgi:hypothetical protein